MTREYTSFETFFPYYLREHAKPATRRLHYVGSTLVLLVLVAAIVLRRPLWLLAMPVAGYFFAWISHAFVERNKPATFTYPLWSLMSDFKMYFLALAGQLEPHLERAGVTPEATPNSTPDTDTDQ